MVKRKTSSRKKSTPAVDKTTKSADTATFPVVGIGASAGGLEAFEEFFCNMPPDSGLSFVLVPHLDPEHASLLCEILQRNTTMPVVEAMDQMAVKPDHVYIIPPNREMSIFHGALQLSTPEMPHGQRMPIDTFLRSLAEDQGEHAIGIILSGTGTDGTLGLRDIIGAGGVTLVQTPATAKYDGMPASAVKAGYATQVLPVEKIPAALLAGVRKLPVGTVAPSLFEKPAQIGDLNLLLMLIRTATGHDFSLYKKSTISRRIERRMDQHNLSELKEYIRYLKEHPAEMPILFKELLINVTSFFRDPEAFVALKDEVLPQLLKDKPSDYVFRVWVAGGATGEEAYSIAILLREFMDENHREFKVQLYSTDLSEVAIDIARTGLYPPNIASDVTPERLRRFFIKGDDGYQVKKEIREMVVFATQNVIKDPPFTKLDLLSCRNLMIYLEPELQLRLIHAFHYALNPDGVLLLSSSESIGNNPELFMAINRKWKLYRAVGSTSANRAVLAGGQTWTVRGVDNIKEEIAHNPKDDNIAEITRQALVRHCAPAAVLTDLKGNILFVHGDTGRYLRPAPGQANLNVVNMAREFLQLELRSSMAAASKGEKPQARDTCISYQDENQAVHLSVRPIKDPDGNQSLLLVIFQDVACHLPASSRDKGVDGSSSDQRVESLERDLLNTRETLQASIEEEQAANEELKSANEELQSTNEEMQSTNEELETSREELQSVNEELITVNAELQAKIEQLSDMQNDMKNLLDNFSVGTIFLDEHMHIRRFTREALHIYRLVASDVGRPLSDIKSDFEDDDLLVEAQTVLNTLVPSEQELRAASGAWYLVRIQPYRTLDNVIAGVVISFTDISQRVKAEVEIRDALMLAENIVNTVHEPLLVLDSEMTVVSASRSFFSYFKTAPQETVGKSIFALGNGQWDIRALRELLETVLPRDTSFDGFIVEHDFPEIGRRKLLLNARRIEDEASNHPLILLAIRVVVGSD